MPAGDDLPGLPDMPRGPRRQTPPPKRGRKARRKERARRDEQKRDDQAAFDTGGRTGSRERAPERERTPRRERAAKRERTPRRGRAAGLPTGARLLVVLIGAVAILLVGLLGLRAAYAGRTLPGTQIGGEDVGGMTRDELRSEVEQLLRPNRRISLRVPRGQTLQISAEGAGLLPNVEASVERAMEAGRSDILSPARALLGGQRVALVGSFDESALQSTLDRVAEAVDGDPYEGGISIDPDTRAVTVVASRPGRQVDVDRLGDQIRDTLLRYPTRSALEIPVTQTTPVPASRLRELADQAEEYVATPIELTGAGEPYEVSVGKVSQLLALEPKDGGTDAVLGVDPDELSQITRAVARARDRSAKDATISAPAQSATVVDGKGGLTWRPKAASVSVTSDGQTGLSVNVKELNGRIREAVSDRSHEVEVPVDRTKPTVSASQAKKVDDVIGTFTTYYPPGQPRVTNIRRMARSIDRTVIPAGGQFSLNQEAGERTKAKGYVEAPYIGEGNVLEPSVGGGVSQFSTTMYNAAYFAGLQIDAHMAHTLFIDRYPAGRESTLNWPNVDLRWTNDTDAPILVRAASTPTSVTVTLYGDNGDRRVSSSPGSREPNPGGDFQITVTRRIQYGDGRTVSQPVTTRYGTEGESDEND